MYDPIEGRIIPESINDGFQTGTSVKVTRLAFNLFNDGTPTALSLYQKGDIESAYDECQKYSVSDIFCCSYAPYFVEAIKLRYPEYLQGAKRYE
jgi:hypothetical protein